jgi:4-amino-4-deoxy-L-arabinose transferase-like glycosyltransferase
VILVAGAALRFATLSSQSFWLDEAIAIHSARLDLGGLIHSVAHTEGSPPLYFVLLDGWMRVFGDSEAGIRSLSALFGTATILLAYVIGRRLASARVGLVAAALVAFNPLLVWFSQEARPYALLVLLAAASFLLFAEALERPTGRVLGGWALASGLAFATHYFAGLVILPELAWLAYRVRPWRLLAPAVAGFAVVPLALIPLVATQGQFQDYAFVKGEAFATRVFAQVPKQWLVGYDAPAETLVVILSAAAALAGAWLAATAARGRERRAAFVGAVAGLSALAIALVMALFGADYYLSRYLLAAWLPLALAIAVGFDTRRAGLGIAALLCALWVFVVVSVNTRPELQRDDWRGIARAMGVPDPHGRAVVVSPINGGIPLRLYLPRSSVFPAAGAQIGEVDVVAAAPREAGATRTAPPVRKVLQLPGFRQESVHQGRTFTVVKYRAKAPAPETRVLLYRLALHRGTPDFLIQQP